VCSQLCSQALEEVKEAYTFTTATNCVMLTMDKHELFKRIRNNTLSPLVLKNHADRVRLYADRVSEVAQTKQVSHYSWVHRAHLRL
jgi:hypothetical protein